MFINKLWIFMHNLNIQKIYGMHTIYSKYIKHCIVFKLYIFLHKNLQSIYK